MKELDKCEKMWFAAITDCDGAIWILRHRRKSKYKTWYSYEGVWSFCNTDKRILKAIKQKLGLKQKIGLHKKTDEKYRDQYISFKPQYGISIVGIKDLDSFIRQIKDYLIIKKNKLNCY